MKKRLNEANVHDIYWNRPQGGVIVEEVSPNNYLVPKMFNEGSLLTAVMEGRNMMCIDGNDVQVLKRVD